jgi:hypothetical protein
VVAELAERLESARKAGVCELDFNLDFDNNVEGGEIGAFSTALARTKLSTIEFPNVSWNSSNVILIAKSTPSLPTIYVSNYEAVFVQLETELSSPTAAEPRFHPFRLISETLKARSSSFITPLMPSFLFLISTIQLSSPDISLDRC